MSRETRSRHRTTLSGERSEEPRERTVSTVKGERHTEPMERSAADAPTLADVFGDPDDRDERGGER